MMEQPFVLCGLGRIGWRVLEYLQAAGYPVVVIDTHCTADDPRLGKARLVRGDCRRQETLAQASVQSARGVLILTSDDLLNITAALGVRGLNPDVRIVIRMLNENLIPRLGQTVRNILALSATTLTGPLLALSALTGQALGTFRIQGVEHGRRQLAEVAVPPGSPLSGQRLAAIAAQQKLHLVAHYPAVAFERLLFDVNPEATLETGDRLVVCGHPRDIAPLVAGDEEAPHVRWASVLRRNGRMLLRTLKDVDLPVKICGGILISVILISTLVLRYGAREHNLPGGREYSLTKAFFRTVSLMATGSDMQEQDYDTEGAKVYAASLRIVGALLTAAFTAIVTNYLLRAQLGGALEVRKMPDSGHVIVCGLGSIGFRVVEELVRSGEKVVVIERDRNNPFITTVRGLSVPVILGDATVREVLRQGHSPTALAVVAATTNDLTNLEIALLAREDNPQQRVIPCLADAYLAKSLREAADIRLTVSVPNLAAPAFVAALWGDRVLSVFLLGSRMLAVIDLLLQEQDTYLLGQTVQAVTSDYHMQPLAVIAADGKVQPNALEARLELGWRLVALLTLSDLEKLFRRQRPQQEGVSAAGPSAT